MNYSRNPRPGLGLLGLLGLLAPLALTACAGDTNKGTTAKLTTLTITPQKPTLKVRLTGGEKLQLVASGSYSDGSSGAVQGVSWSLTDPSLGSIDAAGQLVASGRGGATTINAAKDGVSASTSLTVSLEDTLLDGAATAADLQRLQQGAAVNDPTKAPTLLYPLAGAMIPRNLPPMQVQWTPATGNTLFGLTFEASGLKLLVATTDKLWQPSTKVWSALTSAAKGSTVKLSIIGGGQTGTLYSAGSQTLEVSAEAVSGTIYYWATGPSSSLKNGIVQILAGTATANDFYTQANNGTKRCAGCHAMSRDGKKMIFTEYNTIPDDWTNWIKGIEVKTKQPFVQKDKLIGNFFTFSPKGDRIVSAEAGVLTLRSGSDASTLSSYDGWAGKRATHPDWSPVEDRLVFSLYPSTYNHDESFCAGSIAISALPPGTWAPKLLVASSGPNENNYYPTFSPDGKYVAFNRAGPANNASLGESTCDYYGNPSASLHLVPSAGGTPVTLQGANGKGNVTNSWPKWAPALSGAKIWWLAFSSTRDYGNLLANSLGHDIKGSKKPQIWVTAIRLDKLGGGSDPSYPAFWLPGQRTNSGNHIPFWTKTLQ
jgi:WD40-like Beta Propeller Repeat